MCRTFICKKFRKKVTPTPALYLLSKNIDSGGGVQRSPLRLTSLPQDQLPSPPPDYKIKINQIILDTYYIKVCWLM